jgi:hypothetical protein
MIATLLREGTELGLWLAWALKKPPDNNPVAFAFSWAVPF